MPPLPDDPLGQFLRAMPKVEIHCHLLGTVQKDTLIDLVAHSQSKMDRATIEDFYTRGPQPKGILHVLRALDAELITRANDLHRLTYEYLQSAAAHSVRYAEFFWNPTGTAKLSKIPYVSALDAIVRAISDAEHDHRIVGRLVPAIDREASADDAFEMVEWVVANPREEVIGLGIDYRENDRPTELFWKAFRLAKRHGLKTTAHAGEFGMPWTYIESAIDLIGVDRIDHGYTVLQNPDLVRRCAESGIVFTVVPTNSYYLRTLPPDRWAQDHPIRAMPRAGIRIHPNTDDPSLHLIDPTGAWRMMVESFGFGLDDLRAFMMNGLDGAWLSDATRHRWHAEWTTEFDRLRASIMPNSRD
jgi:adenosine deaminase